MKFLLIGDAGHGKDTVAEIWKALNGITFNSSSMQAAQTFLFDKINKDPKMPSYGTIVMCHADRKSFRQYWFDAISEYNEKDPTRLCKEILKNNDGYIGLRSRREFQQARIEGLFDIVIWVDRSSQVDGEETNELTKEDADIVLDLNGSMHEAVISTVRLGNFLFGQKEVVYKPTEHVPWIKKEEDHYGKFFRAMFSPEGPESLKKAGLPSDWTRPYILGVDPCDLTKGSEHHKPPTWSDKIDEDTEFLERIYNNPSSEQPMEWKDFVVKEAGRLMTMKRRAKLPIRIDGYEGTWIYSAARVNRVEFEKMIQEFIQWEFPPAWGENLEDDLKWVEENFNAYLLEQEKEKEKILKGRAGMDKAWFKFMEAYYLSDEFPNQEMCTEMMRIVTDANNKRLEQDSKKRLLDATVGSLKRVQRMLIGGEFNEESEVAPDPGPGKYIIKVSDSHNNKGNIRDMMMLSLRKADQKYIVIKRPDHEEV